MLRLSGGGHGWRRKVGDRLGARELEVMELIITPSGGADHRGSRKSARWLLHEVPGPRENVDRVRALCPAWAETLMEPPVVNGALDAGKGGQHVADATRRIFGRECWVRSTPLGYVVPSVIHEPKDAGSRPRGTLHYMSIRGGGTVQC